MNQYKRHMGPSDEEKKGGSVAFPVVVVLAILGTFAVIIAMVIKGATQTPPETRYQQELEKLQFSNIELKNVLQAGETEAWVSVGGCRIHLKRSFHESEGWRLTGESVVAGISGEPTIDMIRQHPKYQGCAKEPAPTSAGGSTAANKPSR